MVQRNLLSATRWLWLSVATLAMGACVTEGPSLGLEYFGDGSAGTETSTTGQGGGATGAAGDGIPCDVADLLDVHCNGCHASGATAPALDSLASLLAPSASDPGRTVAEVSLDTMTGAGSTMPPAGLLSDAQVAPFAAWVAAGMPSGSCGDGAGGSGPNPFDTPPVCTTNTFWNQGDEGSSRMYPGRACNDCHVSEAKGPVFEIAGTVYPSAHEPDDCYGTTGDLVGGSVEILDANGQQLSLPIRSAGNFSLKDTPVAFPVTVKVVFNGNEIAMQAPVSAADGDCNTCHTQDGTQGAPGRILIP